MRLVGPALAPARFATLNEALAEAARSPHGLCLIDPRGEETLLPFADIHARAGRCAASLLSSGLEPGQRVAICLPTGPDFFDAYFGTLLAGAVPVPVAPPSSFGRTEDRLRTIGGMLQAVGASVIVTNDALMAQVRQAAAMAVSCRLCVTAGTLLATAASAALPVDPSAPGVIQFSSGSTSRPKPIALSHRSLLAQVAALEQLMGADGVGVTWLPMHHDMGLIGCLLSAVYQARPLALMAPETFLIRPVSWLRAISRHRATASSAPNFGFRQCLLRVRDVDLEGLDLSSWRIALNGAEAVSSSLMRQFGERFAEVGFRPDAMAAAYGLAESSLAVTTTIGHPVRALQVDPAVLAETGRVRPPGQRSREIMSVGRAVPGAEVEVRHPDGSVAAEGRVGRIYTRGPSVMSGYFDDPAATSAVLRDGWLDTGDLGFIDGGELFISGRAKEIIIVRGSNHSPQEFEECLADVQGLAPGTPVVAAGYVPAGADDEELLILVEGRVGSPGELPRRVASAILDRTGIRPHAVVMLEQGALPRTTSGKLRRLEALRRYLQGDLRQLPMANAATEPAAGP